MPGPAHPSRLHRLSGHAVLGLSLFAFALVGGALVLMALGKFHPSPDGDEGTPAHLFQLAIALLVPAGMVHLGTADWRTPRNVAKRLLLPAVLVLLAFAALFVMEHRR